MRELLAICCLAFSQFVLGQTPPAFYKTADSLYKIKDYKGSAIAYMNAIRMQSKDVTTSSYINAANAWTMAKIPDSAFKVLDIIAKSNKTSKVDLNQIEYGVDFAGLQNDKRWKPLVDRIRLQANKNGYPQEELIYGRKDGMALTMIKVSPKIKANGKAIIYVVSGSWISFYNGIEISTSAAEQYLARGYTIFAAVHGSQPRFAIPDALSDIKRAVRYVRFNAMKFGIDPNHIGITGTSAGGHLSLMVATSDDNPNLKSPDPVDRVSSRVQAVAVLFPPTDFLNWGSPGQNLTRAKDILKVAKTWGAVNFTVWNDRYRLYEEVTDTVMRDKIGKEISPIYFVSADDPPVFIIHGDADPTVPLQQSKAIIARFNEVGVPNKFIIKPGGKHNGEQMYPEWLEFVDWFDKYLK